MMVMASSSKLRERQAQIARGSILDAVIAKLEQGSVDDFSMQDVADAAGVSLRTVYRYFPNRGENLTAAGERIGEMLGLPIDLKGPEDIVNSFLEVSGKFAEHPHMARALVSTPAGRDARNPFLRPRRAAIEQAMARLTANLDQEMSRQATAVVTYLCSASSWVTISDDNGFRVPTLEEPSHGPWRSCWQRCKGFSPANPEPRSRPTWAFSGPPRRWTWPGCSPAAVSSA